MIGGRRAFNPPAESTIPWFAFALLTVAFFIALHDPTRSLSISDDYMPNEETIQKNVSEGNSKRQIGFLIAGAFGALVMVSPRRRKVEINGVIAVLVIFFLAWLMMSVLWAEDRSITFRRLIVIAILCTGALAVAVRMNLRDIMLLVFWSSIVYLLVGILSEIAMGSFNLTHESYRFAGTIHPNNQGINCSLIVLSAVGLAHRLPRWRAFFIAAALLGFAFLVLTKSRTSMGSMLLALFLYLFIAYRNSKPALFIACATTTLGLIILFVGQDALMPTIEKVVLLGRGDQDMGGAMNLTGRLPLWQHLMEYAAHRPFHGYGYGSFFTVKHIEEITARQDWPIAECHSVFLEVLMGLGLVGVVTYTLVQFMAMRHSLVYFNRSGDHGYLFLFALLTYGFVGGMAESTLLVPTMQTFVHFIAIAFLSFQLNDGSVRDSTPTLGIATPACSLAETLRPMPVLVSGGTRRLPR
jgi:O-antigen ligase